MPFIPPPPAAAASDNGGDIAALQQHIRQGIPTPTRLVQVLARDADGVRWACSDGASYVALSPYTPTAGQSAVVLAVGTGGLEVLLGGFNPTG